MFTIAHLSDVHLAPMPVPRLRDLSLKRALGFANWHRRRKTSHLTAVLDVVVADLKRQAPDHIVVTGDLVNIGLPSEHAAAQSWLETLGSSANVTVVPGNHDAYVGHIRDPGFRRWSDYMRSNEAGAPFAAPGRGGFPFVRVLGDIALVGLSSAVPTPPLVAGGRLGRRQRSALGEVLSRLGAARIARVVLLHHPPLRRHGGRLRGLSDARGLTDILRASGSELVLFGHNHRRIVDRLGDGAKAVPLVGAPSASAFRHAFDHPAGYHLFRIERRGEGFAIEMEARTVDADGRHLDSSGRVALWP